MIAEPKTVQSTGQAPVESHPSGVSARIEHLKNELTPRWNEFWTSAIDAAGAEMSVVALKAARALIVGALGVVSMMALLALGIYGFTLLDACFDFALQGPGLPVWLSPLVRGLLYFGLMAGVFGCIWGFLFGAGKPASAQSEGREAARG